MERRRGRVRRRVLPEEADAAAWGERVMVSALDGIGGTVGEIKG